MCTGSFVQMSYVGTLTLISGDILASIDIIGGRHSTSKQIQETYMLIYAQCIDLFSIGVLKVCVQTRKKILFPSFILKKKKVNIGEQMVR